jgi:hypothetical protein
MSSNPIDPVSANSSEWNEAWKSVRRLADARRGVLEGAATQNGSFDSNTSNRSSRTAVDPATDDILFISAQAQHDLAEIESASAVLRIAQPDLEAWSSPNMEAVSTRKPRSVWIVVGVLWVSTVLLMAMAGLAIASLLR